MDKRFLPLFTVLIINFILSGWLIAIPPGSFNASGVFEKDSIPPNQLLYNGRVWRNLYASVHGDPFLFSDEFMPGQVTMNGKTFSKLRLRYDILNDEIVTITDKGIILQLNREMIEEFTITYKGRIYNFLHLITDSLDNLSGYVNVVYEGNSGLYVKSRKEISGMGPGKNYEDFFQVDRIFLLKDGIFTLIRSNRDFKREFSDRWSEIKEYKTANRIKLSVKSPDSYVPVLIFFDSLMP
ncbi:MAG TPA: hypothetical protein VMV47_14755 [Bacteroidales bacterium]|nr:hypothetical protein [Bacteroidales bacterium]